MTRVPAVDTFARKLVRTARKWLPKVRSDKYWEERYRTGRTSGAGSYGRLAHFKARVINDFVAREKIQSVIDFGSGDGAQLELADYPSYIGIDVSHTAVAHCRRKFADNPSYRFLHASEWTPEVQAELALSLDVIYHLVEDSVFSDYMERLFDSARRFVIIYSSNSSEHAPATHVRHRRFTDWVAKHRPDFALVEVIENEYPFDPEDPENTSFADFFVYKRVAGAAGDSRGQ